VCVVGVVVMGVIISPAVASGLAAAIVIGVLTVIGMIFWSD
jgi:hypothetical protein